MSGNPSTGCTACLLHSVLDYKLCITMSLILIAGIVTIAVGISQQGLEEISSGEVMDQAEQMKTIFEAMDGLDNIPAFEGGALELGSSISPVGIDGIETGPVDASGFLGGSAADTSPMMDFDADGFDMGFGDGGDLTPLAPQQTAPDVLPDLLKDGKLASGALNGSAGGVGIIESEQAISGGSNFVIQNSGSTEALLKTGTALAGVGTGGLCYVNNRKAKKRLEKRYNKDIVFDNTEDRSAGIYNYKNLTRTKQIKGHMADAFLTKRGLSNTVGAGFVVLGLVCAMYASFCMTGYSGGMIFNNGVLRYIGLIFIGIGAISQMFPSAYNPVNMVTYLNLASKPVDWLVSGASRMIGKKADNVCNKLSECAHPDLDHAKDQSITEKDSEDSQIPFLGLDGNGKLTGANDVITTPGITVWEKGSQMPLLSLDGNDNSTVESDVGTGNVTVTAGDNASSSPPAVIRRRLADRPILRLMRNINGVVHN